MCALMMLQMSFQYSLISIALMAAIYIGLRRTRKGERDLTAIFQGTMFQLTRRLQITLQKNHVEKYDGGWRPSIVAVTRFGDRRLGHFDLLRWISHRHGFGHFVQYFQGEYSREDEAKARTHVDKLIERVDVSGAGIFVDSLICPSFRQALAQTLQMPGISGLPNNCILLEFDKDHPEEIDETAEGARLAAESMFNVLVLRSTNYRFGYRSSIHLWVTEDNLANAPLMLLLAYIVVGHRDWRRAEIRLFACHSSGETEHETQRLASLMSEGRLPISMQNVTSVECASADSMEEEVSRRSSEADLVIAAMTEDEVRSDAAEGTLRRYNGANDVLFVHARENIAIE